MKTRTLFGWRIVVIAVILVLAAAVLVGCGSASTPEPTQAPAPEPTHSAGRRAGCRTHRSACCGNAT